MKRRFYLFLPIYFSFFVGLGVYEVIHPPFSTDSTNIGNYQIKIDTTPPIPEVGKNSVIHFTVLDTDGNPVDNFRMGLKILYNDDLLTSSPISDHQLGKWDFNYIFGESGNHVIRIEMFDLKSGQLLTHAFNLSVLSMYMNMFTYLVISGIAGAIGIVVAIMIYQKKFKKG